jgi:XTP/dITP diphosphohydrolase
MARRLQGGHLVIASHNDGKVREIRALLAPRGLSVGSAREHGVPEPAETGDSFVANAVLKAHAVAQATTRPALSDDSGLVVPALGGAPGTFSARWAGPRKDFAMAMARVERELAGRDPRAFFVCALAIAWPDGHAESFEGTIHGRLVFPPRGTHGFGYDPIFVPEGHAITFGEMDPAAKHGMSHRARAFAQFEAACLWA